MVNANIELKMSPALQKVLEQAPDPGVLTEALAARLRPVMLRLDQTARDDARYQAIADTYELEEKQAADTVYFAFGNTNEHTRYLVPGTRPHLIPRAFGRPGAVHHPGTAPDSPVLAAVQQAAEEVRAEAVEGVRVYVKQWGRP